MIRRWRRALAFIFMSSMQGHKGIFTAVAGLELVQGLASPAAAIGLKTLTNGVIASRSSATLAGATVLAAVVAAQWAAAGASFRLRLALRERTHFVLSQRIAALTSRNPGIEAFEDAETSNRIELARRGLPLAAQGGGTITATAGILIQVGITLVLLFRAHPALTLLPLLGYPTVRAGLRSQQRLKAAEERSAQDMLLARHIAEVATSTGPAKEIRVFGLQDLLVERQQAAWNRAHASRMEAVWSSATAQALSGAVFALGLAGAVLLTATAAVQGRASAGDVLLVLFLAQQLQGNLTAMRARLIRVTDILNAAERILSIEPATPARTPAPHSEPSPVPNSLGMGITLEGVGFRYPNAEHWALRGVDLTLQPGMVLALVGENGAGKTTLVKLLLRLYEPTEGRILIEGTDITAFDAAEWQGATSAAFQDFSRWEFLAREAVGIGDVARIDALEAVEHALARAGASSLAEQLPQGLQTQLGNSWTGGIDLSEGQWQKVAIGRVLMRASPLLVVLDEPTASLDAPTEHALFRHYAEIAREDPARVTVLVSHRFSTVRMADLIVVLEGGRVIERGTHEDLMRLSGTYAALFETQLEGYRA